ncbi:ABC transporter ATP-binding protein [bacterium]|nr:ABC transporter ATP-binding protein [bacterium]
MDAAVQISELSKTYQGLLPWARHEVRAVRDVTLAIRRGEIFGLLGPNGAGKTTAIKMIAGLVEPTRGRISFPAFKRRPAIGAVLEGSRNLYWRLSAWENIRYFGEIKGVPLAQLREQAAELMELFGIADKRDRPAQTLSRGMQQKLAVVLAFLGEPELLLLDEPTLGLDVASSQTIQRLLKRLCAERELTIIVTTHQMDVAQSLCKRVGIMRDGRIAACSPVAELVEHFKRQDYILGFNRAALPKVEQHLAAEQVDYEVVDGDWLDQARLRVKLPAARAVYALMAGLERLDIELTDFRQELPTLEDIFLSITGGEGGAA